MPNHEWLKPLKEHAAKLQNELDTINGVLALYDKAEIPPPAVSVPKVKKAGKVKKEKPAKHVEKIRNRILPEHKNALRVLIAKGRSNDEIQGDGWEDHDRAHLHRALRTEEGRGRGRIRRTNADNKDPRQRGPRQDRVPNALHQRRRGENQ